METDQDYESWEELASCFESGVDFFPGKEDEKAIRAAKAICSLCEVQSECLDYAIETNQPLGVWGGLTEKERKPIRLRYLSNRRNAWSA